MNSDIQDIKNKILGLNKRVDEEQSEEGVFFLFKEGKEGRKDLMEILLKLNKLIFLEPDELISELNLRIDKLNMSINTYKFTKNKDRYILILKEFEDIGGSLQKIENKLKNYPSKDIINKLITAFEALIKKIINRGGKEGLEQFYRDFTFFKFRVTKMDYQKKMVDCLTETDNTIKILKAAVNAAKS